MNKLLNGKFRFVFWLILFFALLLFIPLMLQNNFNGIAKITGIVVILGLFIALSVWRHQTLRKKSKQSPIYLNANDRFWLNKHIPFYRDLSAADRLIFENRLGLFLSNVAFKSDVGYVVDKPSCFYVASSAVMSFWPFHFSDFRTINAIVLGDLPEMSAVIQIEKIDNASPVNVFVHAHKLRTTFDNVTISELASNQLKSFLSGGMVSPTSFSTIVDLDLRRVWFQLLALQPENACHEEMLEELKQNKSAFSTRYPDLALILGSSI